MARSITSRLIFVALASAACAPGPPAEHWAWRSPTRPATPEIPNPKSQVRNPIDAFILAKLRIVRSSLCPPADRFALIRRVTFDLIGLPPTPEEIDAFVNNSSPNAWERVIDRLLASPRYGERWGRHWLDLARYADSNGFEHDEVRPNAWRYRDYVIRSLNADKPYDRFVVEQLAGDEAFPGDRDALTATGFNLLGPDMTDSADQAQRRLNTLNDMTDTAGLVFLGLTITCARCHDHKFEPIPQSDYYRLQAFFAPAVFRSDLSIAMPEVATAHATGMQHYLALTQSLRNEIATLEDPVRGRLFEAKLAKLSAEAQAAHRVPADQRNGGQQELVAETEKKVTVTATEIANALSVEDRTRLKTLQQKLKAFDGQKPAPLPVAMGLNDRRGAPPATYLLERGELANRAGEMQPGFPTVLSSGRPTIAPTPDSTGRRLALARWIARPDNPLTARVIVNRLWQHHFGRGLVPTASDFGLRGERPTHPELLDWLATELTADGWRLKRIHKLMLMSATYQQSTLCDLPPDDSENRLLTRMNRLRLEGEAIRDALLAISGRLNGTMGGPGVTPPVAAEVIAGTKAWTASPNPRDHVRRSVYLFNRRNLRHPFLEAFDLPDSNLSCPRRERSTTAPQSLALLNAVEVMAAAEALAGRLLREAPSEDERIDLAYQLTLGRRPSVAERDRALLFLRDSPLSELCRALFNLNEFVYVD